VYRLPAQLFFLSTESTYTLLRAAVRPFRSKNSPSGTIFDHGAPRWSSRSSGAAAPRESHGGEQPARWPLRTDLLSPSFNQNQGPVLSRSSFCKYVAISILAPAPRIPQSHGSSACATFLLAGNAVTEIRPGSGNDSSATHASINALDTLLPFKNMPSIPEPFLPTPDSRPQQLPHHTTITLPMPPRCS